MPTGPRSSAGGPRARPDGRAVNRGKVNQSGAFRAACGIASRLPHSRKLPRSQSTNRRSTPRKNESASFSTSTRNTSFSCSAATSLQREERHGTCRCCVPRFSKEWFGGNAISAGSGVGPTLRLGQATGMHGPLARNRSNHFCARTNDLHGNQNSARTEATGDASLGGVQQSTLRFTK